MILSVAGILSTALLQLVSSGELELDDAISSWWDGFIRYGKRAVTVQQLLTHRAGLHRALPADLTLSRLADYGEMVRIVEDATPACAPGSLGRYAYLTYGWAVSELVRCVSGISIDAFVRERLLEPLGLEEEVFFRLPLETEGTKGELVPQNCTGDEREFGADSQSQHSSLAPEHLSQPQRRRSSSASVRAGSRQLLNLPSAAGLRHSSLSRQKEPSQQDSKANASQGARTRSAVANINPHPSLNDASLPSQGIGEAQSSNGDVSSQRQQPVDSNLTLLLQGSKFLLGEKGPGKDESSEMQAAGSNQGLESRDADACSGNWHSNQFSQVLPTSESRSAALGNSKSYLLSASADPKPDDHAASSNRLLSGDDPAAILSRGSNAFAERKLQLSAFPQNVEIVRADTPVLWRLTSARRKISFSPMTQQEVLQRLEQAKGKLQVTQGGANEMGAATDDAQTRRCIASAVRHRRRRLHNLRGSSGPIERNGGTRPRSARSVESLPDVFSHSKMEWRTGDDHHSSDDQGSMSHSDGIMEEREAPESDLNTPGFTLCVPGAAPRVSVLELIRTKPHVMDPLIYDSHRIVHQLIPPTNCRCTARALARFYAALGEGRIISKPLLDAARVSHTSDPTLETLLLTGGGSRTWGLGYQLYDCTFLSSPGSGGSRAGQSSHAAGALLHSRSSNAPGEISSWRSRRKLRESGGFGYCASSSMSGPQVDAEALLRDRGLSSSHPWGATLGLKPRGVVGLGHGDVGGSVAMCFPEMNLSISILLNDVLTGPEVRSDAFFA